jgi:hypothetical protein
MKALGFVSLALLVVAGGTPPVGAERGHSENAGLQAVRAFTERYHSESVALADGFTATDDCVPAMGYHYVNFARLDTTLEPSRPEALLYAPTADGGRRLAGAEWIVIDSDQDLSTDEDLPALFGHDFDGPMPGHVPGMPIHYDLHAHSWVENPDGGFAAWNPAVTCP